MQGPGFEPKELALKAGTILFKAKAFTAAAIVLAEAAKLAPNDPAVLAPLGAALGNGVGVLVRKPFILWSTRTMKRALAMTSSGPYADIARRRLDDMRAMIEYEDAPALEPEHLDEMLAFLDIDPSILVEGVDVVPENDRMSMAMTLGDLANPRFIPVIAAALEGRWGGGAARASLKRFRPFAHKKSIRDALTKLRAGPLAAECRPYLDFAEKNLPEPIEDDTIPVPRAVENVSR